MAFGAFDQKPALKRRHITAGCRIVKFFASIFTPPTKPVVAVAAAHEANAQRHQDADRFLPRSADVLTFCRRLDDQHGITIAEETVFLLDRFLVGFHDQVAACESAHQNQ